MCWQYEWARAVNNLEWAKIHITRAAEKTEKRGLKDAAEVSRDLIKKLEHVQWVLKNLREDFGIERKRDATTPKKLLMGQRRKVK